MKWKGSWLGEQYKSDSKLPLKKITHLDRHTIAILKKSLNMSIAVVYKMRKHPVLQIHGANMTDKMEQMTHFHEVNMSCMSLRCDYVSNFYNKGH